MVSIKLLFSLSVSILLLLNVQEATLVSQSDGSTNWTDIDLSDPEHTKQAIAVLSQYLIQLKEEMQIVKEEAKEDMQRVREEAEEKIQDAKDQLEREMQKNKNETQTNTLTIKQIASGVTSLRPPLGADYSHSFRTSRNVDPLETFGAANYSLLEQFVRLMLPVSCYEWRQHGFDISGYYLVDPDGRGMGEPPFTVYCDMISGYTFVHHDSEGRRQAESCSGPKCSTINIEYSANTQQILALMLLSDSCQQYVKIDCFESPLKKDGEVLSTWTDRQGREQEYWAGDGDSHMCACGMSKACIDPRKPCNCDASVQGVTLSDQGYLSDVASLPVAKLHIGSVIDEPLHVNYTVGPLRCFGSKPVSEPRSCRDVLVSGLQRSGYYFLDSNRTVDLVYCNMTEVYRTLHSDVESPEKPMNLTQVKRLTEELEEYKHQVAFSAYATEDITSTGSTIIFNEKSLDIGGGYNAGSGVFTAPVAGLYFISVHLVSHHSYEHLRAELRKNGTKITGIHSYTYDARDYINQGISIIERLEIGDKLEVFLNKWPSFIYYNGARFNGFLLK